MRCKLICLLLGSVGLWCGCQKAASEAPTAAPQTTVALFRWHFVGSERLAQDTNAAHWVKLRDLPATLDLREQTLKKLARAPFQLFQQRIAATTNDAAALFRPLLDDLLRAESYAELRAVTNQTPEFALAIRLDPAAASVWDTNLPTMLAAWIGAQPSPIRVAGQTGWELKKHDPPNLIQFLRAGQWVVLSCGEDKLPLQAELLARISSHGHPWEAASESWLNVTVDWPRLKPYLPVAPPFDLPQTHLSLTGSGDSLRTKMDLVYIEAVQQSFEPWRIPTNTIREPLVSFTACRGILSWLKQIKEVQQFNIGPLPDQIYGWGLANVPFQSFLAVPNQNPTNTLERLATELKARFNDNLRQHGLGTISWSTNTGQLTWTGLPFIFPYLEPVSEPVGPFLLAGVFPNNPRVKPPPAELLGQVVGRTNLVYYDWEITQPRFKQCWLLWQTYQIAFGQPLLKTNAASVHWLNTIGPDLGNAVTELSVTGPKQLSLVRKSAIGLTATELVALATWLESPKFPLGEYRLPARTNATESVTATNSVNAETRR